MVQYYLDLSNEHCNYLLKTIFNPIINSPINNITEAKIREDNNNYILTIKYCENYIREKLEAKIDKEKANALILDYGEYIIEKNSYKIFEDDHHKIDIDEYYNIKVCGKPLIICIMYYDNENKKDAKKYLLEKLNITDYEDITENLSYKNRNLSRHNKLN
ncbi:MAG: hypothetical protein IJW82_03675 [Clostridia bacterium]|nr:hypothetical protein [Clostridia bacterium]